MDPFADVWPIIEGWLIAGLTVAVNELMDRLATIVPDAYASKTQARTLHRRVKAWRAERVKEVSQGSLRTLADTPVEVWTAEKLNAGGGWALRARQSTKQMKKASETTTVRQVTYFREATWTPVVNDSDLAARHRSL